MEKTSIKDFIKDHKGAIIGGIALMTIGYIKGYKRCMCESEIGLLTMMVDNPEFKDAFNATIEAKKAVKS